MTHVLTILAGLSLVTGAQEGAEKERRVAEELAAATARIERIRAEVEDLGEHPWAGAYYNGGLGMSVALYAAPEAGFVYQWTGCLGVYDLNHGDIVEVRDGWMRVELEIDPTLNDGWGSGRHMSPALLAFRWGERRYLIPECEAMSFVNAVNSGRRWIASFFPIRDAGRARADDERPPGLPSLPDPYATMLLAEPVSARVTEVRELRRVGESGGQPLMEVAVQLDAGSRDGLVAGMVVYGLDTPRTISAELKDVREGCSSATFRFVPSQLGDTRLRPGSRLSTRSPQR
jgi:hypothetical protein